MVVLRALTEEEIAALVRRALADGERGLGALGLAIDDDALALLAQAAGGDARVALNTLEVAAALAEGRITTDDVREALQHRSPRYDKAGESHYDTISAFIKSVRDSDPDAAVYWLARMLQAGEDPLFIARRLVILASEDVGLADPQGIQVAVAAQQAVHFLGMPECMYPLAHATLYLAAAPKSNSVGTAYFAALKDAERTMSEPVPLHLRNAPTGLMKRLGYGAGYKYAHTYAGDQERQMPPVERLQHNLPDPLRDAAYYHPRPFGDEARIKRWLDARRGSDAP